MRILPTITRALAVSATTPAVPAGTTPGLSSTSDVTIASEFHGNPPSKAHTLAPRVEHQLLVRGGGGSKSSSGSSTGAKAGKGIGCGIAALILGGGGIALGVKVGKKVDNSIGTGYLGQIGLGGLGGLIGAGAGIAGCIKEPIEQALKKAKKIDNGLNDDDSSEETPFTSTASSAAATSAAATSAAATPTLT